MVRTKHKSSCSSQRACEAGGRIIAQDAASKVSGTLGIGPVLSLLARFSGRQITRQNVCRPFGAQNLCGARYPGLMPGATLCRPLRGLIVAILVTGLLLTVVDISASTASAQSNSNAVSETTRPPQ